MKIEEEDLNWLVEACLDKRLECSSCGHKVYSETNSGKALHATGNVACYHKTCPKYTNLASRTSVDTRNLPPEFIPNEKYAAILKKYSEAPMQSSTSAGQTTCSDNKSLLYKRLSEVTKELSNIHEQLSITLPKKKELEIEYSNITKQLLNNRDQSEDDVLL